MKAIIVYDSKTGFTEKYARYLCEELKCESVRAEQAFDMDLSGYDALVYGGGTYAGSISGLKKFSGKIKSFKGKKAIFATGASLNTDENVSKLFETNLQQNALEDVRAFYMRGGQDYTKMSFVHKIMMKMVCGMIKKQHGADSERYREMSRSFDCTDKNNILPLVDFISA